LNWVGLSISEGVDLQTTIATFIAILTGAVNELLLRKFEEFVRQNGMGAFHGSDGGESPAGTAASLILNRVDLASCNPIDSGSQDLGVIKRFLLDLFKFRVLSLHLVDLVLG